ncbi:MAG: sigma-70 family RNA polymerase sigma factor [Verrucomicrobia bacterium]|nr:sigma-70 family RNA polymerase sigma factor [Verrucomicrobiota bacterium]
MSDPVVNEEACATLYETSAARLILYGRSLGLSHSEAEDVVQEVFVALLRLPEMPDRPAHYLVRAVRNRALNFRRSLLRRWTREFESARWFESGPDESAQERAAMRCLETLPADQREVIVLKIWHGHTFEEIGELLDLSPHTAAGRYRYGMNKLRTCLRDTDPQSSHELAPSLDGPLGTAPGFLDPA